LESLIERVNENKMAAKDGLGFLTDYVCRLVKCYPSFTLRYVWKRLPMIEGWPMYAWAFLDDPMHKFGEVRPLNGYIKQQTEKLIKEAKDLWGKPN
jgi:hypothetical protein